MGPPLELRAATCRGVGDAEQHRAGYRLTDEGKYHRMEVQPLDKPKAGFQVDAAYDEAGLHPRNCKLALERLVLGEECCPPCNSFGGQAVGAVFMLANMATAYMLAWPNVCRSSSATSCLPSALLGGVWGGLSGTKPFSSRCACSLDERSRSAIFTKPGCRPAHAMADARGPGCVLDRHIERRGLRHQSKRDVSLATISSTGDDAGVCGRPQSSDVMCTA